MSEPCTHDGDWNPRKRNGVEYALCVKCGGWVEVDDEGMPADEWKLASVPLPPRARPSKVRVEIEHEPDGIERVRLTLASSTSPLNVTVGVDFPACPGVSDVEALLKLVKALEEA